MSKSFGALGWLLVKKLLIYAEWHRLVCVLCFSCLLALWQDAFHCRVSFDEEASVGMDAHISASRAAELSGAAPTVVKAFPPPAQADVSRICLCFRVKDCKLRSLIISKKSSIIYRHYSTHQERIIITILVTIIVHIRKFLIACGRHQQNQSFVGHAGTARICSFTATKPLLA